MTRAEKRAKNEWLTGAGASAGSSAASASTTAAAVALVAVAVAIAIAYFILLYSNVECVHCVCDLLYAWVCIYLCVRLY